MARAKRTDRSEARRRYRATVTSAGTATEDDDAAVADADAVRPAAPVPGRPAGGAGRSTAGRRPSALDTEPVEPPRPGILGAVTGSIRPLDLRGDLRATPALITQTRAVWVPSLLTVAAAVAYLVPAVRDSAIAPVVIPLFVIQPPMAAPFLAGILAPRASWVAGMIVGLVAALGTLALLPTLETAAGAHIAGITDILYVALLWPLFGGSVAAFAAFYRRFLRFSSPARSARRPAQKGATRGKPAARRR